MSSKHAKELRGLIDASQSWRTGAIHAPESNFNLFYTYDKKKVRHLNLLKANEKELKELYDACDAATFGRGKKDVLDKSYRKAGKLDVGKFSIPFGVTDGGLPQVLRKLLEDRPGEDLRGARAELYKLNVYGPGSFFKAHQDTPRSNNMFGSLVLVFPTNHTGGDLRLKHKDHELIFDSAAAANKFPKPCVAYAAFYSDVEHEVLTVSTGYRVTLTYNLFFTDATPGAPLLSETVPKRDLEMQRVIEKILADKKVLPKGGYIGFGLQHQYPVATATTRVPRAREKDEGEDGDDFGDDDEDYFDDGDDTWRSLRHIVDNLKGDDARLARACTAANLTVSARAIYKEDGTLVMVRKIADFEYFDMQEGVVSALTGGGGWGGGRRQGFIIGGEERDPDVDVFWATPMKSMTKAQSTYAAMGNDATLSTEYADVCLVAKVGKPGKRMSITQSDASE